MKRKNKSASIAEMHNVENRRLFAGIVVSNVLNGNGMYDVTVTGTAKGEAITVMLATAGVNNGKFVITSNGNTLDVLPPTSVATTTCYMGAGDDGVVVSSNITWPVALYGEDGNDQLSGGAAGDYIDGGAGNDSINGQGGDDYVNAGDGNNTLQGSNGNDTLIAGSGTDTFDGGNGVDTVDYSGRTDNLTITLDNAANDGAAGEKDNVNNTVENILTGSGNDLITGSASANSIFSGDGNDTVDGGAGNDSIDGGLGDDILTGSAGDDNIFGNDGNDVIHGNDGNDSLDGGNGDDAIYGDAGNDNLNSVDGVQGNDTLDGGLGTNTATVDALDVVTNATV